MTGSLRASNTGWTPHHHKDRTNTKNIIAVFKKRYQIVEFVIVCHKQNCTCKSLPHHYNLVQMFLLDSTLWWSQCRTTYADQDVLFSCIKTGNKTGRNAVYHILVSAIFFYTPAIQQVSLCLCAPNSFLRVILVPGIVRNSLNPTKIPLMLMLWWYLHWPTPTSWTTKFQNALHAPLTCGCTQSCCCRTAPPRSPSDESHCEKKDETEQEQQVGRW